MARSWASPRPPAYSYRKENDAGHQSPGAFEPRQVVLGERVRVAPGRGSPVLGHMDRQCKHRPALHAARRPAHHGRHLLRRQRTRTGPRRHLGLPEAR